jgi:pimeloyl-[acyl-carrier protein] methyl ester esterase
MTTNRIYYQQMGRGDDIVLLHGWGFDNGVWHSFAPLLADQYRVTLVDLPGYGNSAACSIAPNMALQDRQLIDAVIEQLLPYMPKKAIWVGWSLGGLIATYIAAKFPQRVDLLINVATSPRFVSDTDWPGMEVTVLDQFAQSLLTDHKETLTRFMALQFLGCDQPKQLLQKVKPQLERCGKVSLQTLQQGLHLLKYCDLREEYKKLQLPILQIYGQLDMLAPIKSAAHVEALNVFCQTLVVEKAAHAPFLSHQEYFAKLIKQFIKKQHD